MIMGERPQTVALKGPEELEKMRTVCRMAAELLRYIEPFVKPGVTTEELDVLCDEWTRARGAISAPYGYHGFPKHICTSVNHVVCHGIPSKRAVLKDGDIINIDVTPILDGWHGDASETFVVGHTHALAKKLVDVTRECLELAIAEVKPGARIGDIGAAIQEHAEFHGFSVVREFVGHGIGRRFHMEPQVPHFGKRGKGLRLREGMVFTIEPMINAGREQTRILDDEWTAVTVDGSLSAQFEHTLAVTAGGVEILTTL